MRARACKVQVKSGPLVLDEPTDLPDGAEVELIVINDELSSDERLALHASLDRALADAEAGSSVDVSVYLRRHHAHAEVANDARRTCESTKAERR